MVGQEGKSTGRELNITLRSIIGGRGMEKGRQGQMEPQDEAAMENKCRD